MKHFRQKTNKDRFETSYSKGVVRGKSMDWGIVNVMHIEEFLYSPSAQVGRQHGGVEKKTPIDPMPMGTAHSMSESANSLH